MKNLRTFEQFVNEKLINSIDSPVNEAHLGDKLYPENADEADGKAIKKLLEPYKKKWVTASSMMDNRDFDAGLREYIMDFEPEAIKNKKDLVEDFADYLSAMGYSDTLSVQESVNEAVDIKDIHFEIDPEKQEKMKLEFGARLGGITTKEKLNDANYELKRFRKKIKYWTGNERDAEWAVDVFVPNHYHAIKSSLGNGPHSKKPKPVKWNQKKYDQWIEDMASGDGWKHSHDMAQNATLEKGLVDWVKKNRTDGEDPLERIQWDIESQGE